MLEYVMSCAFVLQLDLLEDQRKKILSQCAFTIQCCWRRYQCRRHHTRQQSATLIQAGKLLVARYHSEVLAEPCGLTAYLCEFSVSDLTVWSLKASW